MLALDQSTHQLLTGGLPSPLRRAAEEAYSAFESMPMPDPSQEDWRYVEIPEEPSQFAIPEAPGAVATPSAVESAFGDLAGRADIVDGHVTGIAGPNLALLAEAGEAETFELRTPADRFAAAAAAFGGSGVVAFAAKGDVVEQPLFVSMEVATPHSVSVPRLLVSAAEASALSVVVEQRSADDMTALVLPDIAVVAGQAARVSVTVVQTWGDATVAVGRHHLGAGRDGFVELAEAGLGGAFSRLHLTVDLAGRGSDARITGVYFGDAEQTLDYRYFMNHQGPDTTSEMFLKGAVAGNAKSVFTGLIRIEPEGQGSNAHQTNRNLVLSDDAEAHSVPNLEILANDVRCGHGSAVGPLDEEQRFYLMSRGLPEPRADRLQVLGFFEEALLRFPRQELEPILRGAAMAKYDDVVA